MSFNLYKVLVSEYAERHFIKLFEKKYKSAWEITYATIKDMLARIDGLIQTTKAEKIHCCDIWYIAKCEFKIAWSNESPKTSWNRIIIFVKEKIGEVHILLVYSKTDVCGHNETSWWEQEIKNSFPEIQKYFPKL